MTTQACKTCEYFTPEDDESYGYPYGHCWWAARQSVPICHPGCEYETGADDGADCLCWRPKGYIETYLAGVRARRAAGPVI